MLLQKRICPDHAAVLKDCKGNDTSDPNEDVQEVFLWRNNREEKARCFRGTVGKIKLNSV